MQQKSKKWTQFQFQLPTSNSEKSENWGIHSCVLGKPVMPMEYYSRASVLASPVMSRNFHIRKCARGRASEGPVTCGDFWNLTGNFCLACLTYFMPECFPTNAPERRARFSNASCLASADNLDFSISGFDVLFSRALPYDIPPTSRAKPS